MLVHLVTPFLVARLLFATEFSRQFDKSCIVGMQEVLNESMPFCFKVIISFISQ